jgi:ribosomal protein L17
VRIIETFDRQTSMTWAPAAALGFYAASAQLEKAMKTRDAVKYWVNRFLTAARTGDLEMERVKAAYAADRTLTAAQLKAIAEALKQS